MPEVGDKRGGYIIDQEAGRGHAIVYQAHKEDQLVALKGLAPDHRSPENQARLSREFEFAQKLHPHVLTIYDRGPFWLAMQYVDGSKSTQLRSQTEQLKTLIQIADALDHLDGHGLVRADVKPANIFVSQNFSLTGAVLIDFSVAYAVVDRPRGNQASLQYVAQEMSRDHAPTAATDEHALACSAVEFLTGASPFVAETRRELINNNCAASRRASRGRRVRRHGDRPRHGQRPRGALPILHGICRTPHPGAELAASER